MEICKKFDSCSAPMCPYAKSLEDMIFYPDEEICTKHQYGWIKAQRKLSRRAKNNETYFTLEMLKRDCIITTGIVGLDPDKPEKQQLAKWLENHKPKRKLSDEEKAEIKERFAKNKGSKENSNSVGKG